MHRAAGTSAGSSSTSSIRRSRTSSSLCRRARSARRSRGPPLSPPTTSRNASGGGGRPAGVLAGAVVGWGAAPTDGLQVVSVARLPATAIDPTVALVLLPSAEGPVDGAARFPVLPGGHARPRAPLVALGALYRPGH